MADGLFAGRYELAELLGSGGMARVQRARDTRMGRTVAIKTLLPELAGDPDARRRFAREARAAGALNHPGIVTVHDQDEVREGDSVVPYLVMEYVEGTTLAQLIRDQVLLTPERAVRITCDILDALAHAHSRGTVHRDVKPANVMITTAGAVKVADFGIARVLDNDARLTTTGSAIGTPSYMSPEQINGDADVDPRSDVYSVGCVLVELLTGKPPFTDGNPLNLMYWHVHTGYNGGIDGVVRPSAKPGGTLRLAASYSTTNLLDPAATYDQASWNIQRLYLRKLIDYAPRPGDAGRALVPDLATDTGKVGSDGLTWTFHLKPGVLFDNGSPVTAQDVKYGVERTFDRTAFGGGPTHLVDLLDQGQHYPGPYKDTDPDRLGLRSVDTPDDSTIVFHLAKPFADFRYVLALSIGAPVPRSADTGDGKDFEKHPVGSGPYKVSTYSPGSSLVMVRNPYWKQSTDTVHSALPDRIELKYYGTPGEVEDALLSGEADLDLEAQTLSDATRNRILADPALKANTDLVFAGTTRFLSLQTNVAPFDHYECRWAVEYAVDRASVKNALGPYNADVATTVLPPTSDGYDPTFTPFNTSAGLTYPEDAKAQLGKCGRPDGFSVTLAGPRGTRTEAVMQSVQASLAKVGIKVTIDSLDTAAFYDTLLTPAKLKAKGWGMVLTGWAADWPTGGGFLRALVEPGGANNYAGLDDSAISSAVDAADAETDPAKAARDWEDIDKKVMSESTMVPLSYVRDLIYRGPRLTNVYEQQVLGGVDLTALGVQGQV
jgi:ABC-type transport system substrate-binding protein